MKKATWVLAPFLAVVALTAVTGCGSEGPTTTVTAEGPTGATGVGRAQGVPRPAQPRPREAVAVVEHFYRLLNAQAYSRAWAFVPESVRAKAGGYEQWKAGYGATLSSDPRNVVVESVGAGGRTVVIGLDLHAVDLDACTGESVSQLFSGSWTLRAAGADWRREDSSFQKVSGGAPTLSSSDCAPSNQGKQPQERVGGCDPNYSGACLEPNSSDYDCQGGGGDGPDYTGPVTVIGTDHFDLDSDGDGQACES